MQCVYHISSDIDLQNKKKYQVDGFDNLIIELIIERIIYLIIEVLSFLYSVLNRVISSIKCEILYKIE